MSLNSFLEKKSMLIVKLFIWTLRGNWTTDEHILRLTILEFDVSIPEEKFSRTTVDGKILKIAWDL